MMDSCTRAALEQLISGDSHCTDPYIADSEWEQCQQPIRFAGLGLSSARAMSGAAYAGSWALVLHSLCDLERSHHSDSHNINGLFTEIHERPNEPACLAFSSAHTAWREGRRAMTTLTADYGLARRFGDRPLGDDDTFDATDATDSSLSADGSPGGLGPLPGLAACTDTPASGFQRRVMHGVSCERFLSRISAADVPSRAALLSHTSPAAGAYLTCIPSHAPLCIPASELATAIALRLGLVPRVCEACTGCRCPCGTLITPVTAVTHLSTCRNAAGSGGAWHARHETLARALRLVMGMAGATTAREQVVAGLARQDGTAGRTDIDATFAGAIGRPPATLRADVAVVDPTAASYVSAASRRAGATAATRAARKRTRYATACQPARFYAAVAETGGHIAADFVQ